MVGGVGYTNGAGRGQGRGAAAKAIGSFVPQITKKSFQKFGFSTTSLLTEWASIVGQEVADVTRPEKIKWPRLPDVHDETAATRDNGATLILRVEAACALDIQYRRSQIIGRINSHFGYNAIREVRLIQAPIKPLSDQQKNATHRSLKTHPASQHDAADDLTAALERLSAWVRAPKTAR